MIAHLLQIASWPVRNVGTWAGNLALANKHPEFQSDVATVMSAAGATVDVTQDGASVTNLPMADFLSANLDGVVISALRIPFPKDLCLPRVTLRALLKLTRVTSTSSGDQRAAHSGHGFPRVPLVQGDKIAARAHAELTCSPT